MSASTGYAALRVALRHRSDEIVARWADVFQTSRLRIPKPSGAEALVTIMSSIVEGLELALPDDPGDEDDGDRAAAAALRPGSHALRELEKSVAFAGASMASSELSGFDVAAAILGLRDVVIALVGEGEATQLRAVFEWLVIMALDSFGSATAMSASERMRDQLERGTPVLTVAPDVPAALLVGDPDSAGLDTIFARLMLLVVRVGAASVIIDASGLEDAVSPALVEALGRFLGHRKVARTVEALVVGLDDQQLRRWSEVAARVGATLRGVDRFEDALAVAIGRAGYRLIKS